MDAEHRASEGRGVGGSGAGNSVALDLLDRATLRRRARNFGIAALVVGAALGGVIGLFAGVAGFAMATTIVAAPLLLLAYSESRKTCWLSETRLAVRAFGTRVVELGAAQRLDILVTDMRGARTVSLLASGPPKNRTLNVPLAMYAGVGGRELGVYPLRRLADALAATGDTRALVLSELLVAQLRSEARGDGAAQRPLYRLASLAPEGRLTRTLHPDAVARFVAALE